MHSIDGAALRTIIVISWTLFTAVLIGSIPVPTEVLTEFLLEVLAALIGVIATVFALANLRRWRAMGLIAAWVFLAGYLVRLLIWANTSAQTWETSIDGGLATVSKDSWLITQHLYRTFGTMGTVP